MKFSARLIELPLIKDDRGSLSFAQTPDHIPFAISRIYYMYDLAPGAERGFHAHKELQTVMIAMAGAFDVVLDDGKARQTYRLDRPSLGLYIPKMIWREVKNFAPGSVCLSLASMPYAEDDYIRDYGAFAKVARKDQ
jgi:dTDP-4-dehydrorhamnose 3,5-epimerase-like enzyme